MSGSVDQASVLQLAGGPVKVKVKVLFAGLQKLLCVFEINESLTKSLVDEILDPGHASYSAKYCGVESWVKKHSADVKLSVDEIVQVIKYVEVYQCSSKDKERLDPAQCSVPIEQQRSDESEVVDTVYPPLVCPFRSEVDAWKTDIRETESKYKASKMDETMLLTRNIDVQSEEELSFEIGKSFTVHHEL